MITFNQDSMERSSSELGTSDQPEAQDGDLIQNARPMAEAELYGDSSTFESVLQSEVGVFASEPFQV